MPKTLNYYEELIESIKDPVEAAAYITAILEEKEPESELLPIALKNIAEAMSELNMSDDQAKLHTEELKELLSKQGSEAIYGLGDWLNSLGLKLTVTVVQQSDINLNHETPEYSHQG